MDLVKQENKAGCVLACIAMLSGKTYSEILAVATSLGYGYKHNEIIGYSIQDEFRIYKELGITVFLHSEFTPDLGKNRKYAVTVPSLNIPGGAHRIVIAPKDCTRDSSDFADYFDILDPQFDTELEDDEGLMVKAKYYDRQSQLKFWCHVTEIVL